MASEITTNMSLFASNDNGTTRQQQQGDDKRASKRAKHNRNDQSKVVASVQQQSMTHNDNDRSKATATVQQQSVTPYDPVEDILQQAAVWKANMERIRDDITWLRVCTAMTMDHLVMTTDISFPLVDRDESSD